MRGHPGPRRGGSERRGSQAGWSLLGTECAAWSLRVSSLCWAIVRRRKNVIPVRCTAQPGAERASRQWWPVCPAGETQNLHSGPPDCAKALGPAATAQAGASFGVPAGGQAPGGLYSGPSRFRPLSVFWGRGPECGGVFTHRVFISRTQRHECVLNESAKGPPGARTSLLSCGIPDSRHFSWGHLDTKGLDVWE